MIAKFSIYDLISNLIPGLVFLWCLQKLLTFASCNIPLDFSGGLSETSILLALGYVTGLMLQAVGDQYVQRKLLLPLWRGWPSDRYLLPEDNTLSSSYKAQIRSLVAERFKVAAEPDIPPGCPPDEKRRLYLLKNAELFQLCHDYVDALSPRPLTFNSQYGLFRCLLTAFMLLALFSALLFLHSLFTNTGVSGPFFLLVIFYACLAGLSYGRCRKRSENFARSVYSLFIAGPPKKTEPHE